jgi:primosomal protein N' (replication factor Y)
MKREAVLRRSLAYPPYTRIIGIHIACVDKDRGWWEAQALGREARNLIREDGGAGRLAVIGPTEAPLSRIRGRYRWQILLKGSDSRLLRRVAQNLAARRTAAGVRIRTDVDPMNFM